MRAGSSAPSGAGIAQALLRASLGGTFVAHGVRHARSLAGTAGWFESIGFREPALQARASAAVEVAAGVALAAGLATPLAASAVVGTMTVAGVTVHRDNGFFITDEGYEYVAVLAAAAVALAALGPGRLSVDGALGLHEAGRGWQRALLAAGGAVVAAGQLRVYWRRPVR